MRPLSGAAITAVRRKSVDPELSLAWQSGAVLIAVHTVGNPTPSAGVCTPVNDTPTIRDSWPGAAFSVRVASVEEGGTDREEGERVATEEHPILERGQGSSD